jgi:hypothetical protein
MNNELQLLLEELDEYVEQYRQKWLSCLIDTPEETETEILWNVFIRSSNIIRKHIHEK